MVSRKPKYVLNPEVERLVIDLRIPYHPIFVLYKTTTEIPALGIENWFWDNNYSRIYTWFIDSDNPKMNLGLKPHCHLIVRTTHGFHYYIDVVGKSFQGVLKQVYRLHKHHGDVKQLRMAMWKWRHGFTHDLLVVRIMGKYEEKDIEIAFERPSNHWELELWKRNLLKHL